MKSNAVEKQKALYGFCDLYCGACYHYLSAFPEGKHLLEDALLQRKNIKGFTCQEYRSDRLYIHPGCAECKIRACAQQKELSHCGLCDEFPCDDLISFQYDGHVNHLSILAELEKLRLKGSEQRLIEQEQQWTCDCGTRSSWYAAFCIHCGAPLKSLHAYETEVNVEGGANLPTRSRK